MFFRLTFFLFLFLASFLEAIPPQFSLKTIKSSAEIFLEYPETHPFGRVKIEQKDSYTFYYYTDNTGKMVAFGRSERDSSQMVVEVYDEGSNLLGVIERAGKAPSNSSYSLYDSSNKAVANGAMNLLGTRLHFTSTDDQKKEVILVYRPFFQLIGDYWYTKIADKEKVDERLIVMVSATHASQLLGGSILG